MAVSRWLTQGKLMQDSLLEQPALTIPAGVLLRRLAEGARVDQWNVRLSARKQVGDGRDRKLRVFATGRLEEPDSDRPVLIGAVGSARVTNTPIFAFSRSTT